MHVSSNLSGIVGLGYVLSIRVVPQYYVTESIPSPQCDCLFFLLPNRKLRVIQTMLFTNLFLIPVSTPGVVCIYSHLAVTSGCVSSNFFFHCLCCILEFNHFSSNKGFLCCQELVFVLLTHCLFVQHLLHQSTSMHV